MLKFFMEIGKDPYRGIPESRGRITGGIFSGFEERKYVSHPVVTAWRLSLFAKWERRFCCGYLLRTD